MIEIPQHGSHPDAEQLAAFAEGALPEHERLHVITHAAKCARCREIAFLSQEPALVEASLPDRAPWRELWRQPWLWGGAMAFAAMLLLLSAFLWTRPGTVQKNNSFAFNKEQAPMAPVMPMARAGSSVPKVDSQGMAGGFAASPNASVQRERGAVAPVVPSFAPQAPVYQATPRAPESKAKANAAPQPSAEAAGSVQKQLSAPQPEARASAAAPMAAAPSPLLADRAAAGLASARVEDLPLNSRNAAALHAPNLRTATNGPLHLQIEHGVGVQEGKARMAGQVLDQSGAAIPRAVVRLTQPAPVDGKERYVAEVSAEAVTDAAGRFTMSAIPVGQYQAQISAPGFVTASQPVDLQSRDVARAETVLAVGAVSEAVEVSAANAQVVTSEVKVDRNLAEKTGGNALPSGLMPVTTVSVGARSVALDAAGTVFARREGKRWTRVKAPWAGIVAKLESSPAAAAAMDAAADKKKAQSLVFLITTAAGVVWDSADGEHWSQR